MKDLRSIAIRGGLWLAAIAAVALPLTAAPDLSPGQEAQLGLQSMRAFEARHTILNDPTLVRQVTAIGEQLVRATNWYADPRPELHYTFGILTSDDLNAFSLIGGHIYVTSGLLAFLCPGGKLLPSKLDTGQLAAVLSHEIAHVALRHQAAAFNAVRRVDPSAGQGADAIPLALAIPLSHTQELDADAYGALILSQAGFPLERAETLLGRLADKYPEYLESNVSDHPSAAERLQNLLIYRVKLEQVRRLFDTGLRALRLAAPDLAIDSLRRVADAFPQSVIAQYNLGVAYHTRYIQSLQTLPPDRPGRLTVFVPPESRKGGDATSALDSAVAAYRRVLEIDPHFEKALANLAMAYLAQGLTSEAQTAAQSAAAAAPGDPDALNVLGTVRLRQRRAAEAAGLFTRAIHAKPGAAYLPGIYNLAVADSHLSATQCCVAWEAYLRHREDASRWLNQGWRQYEIACRDAGHSPLLALNPGGSATVALRPATVRPDEDAGAVRSRLGTPDIIEHVGDTVRWTYHHDGLTLVVLAGRVKAIQATRSAAGDVRGVRVQDTQSRVAQRLGPPSAAQTDERGDIWLYYQPNVSIRLRAGRVAEIDQT